MPDPSDPPTVWRIRNFSTELTPIGDDYDLALVNAGSGMNTLVISIAQGAVETSYCFTDEVPGNSGSFFNSHWQAGDWNFSVEFTSGNGNVDLKNRITRVAADGTVLETQAWSAGFNCATGVNTEGPIYYQWNKGNNDDRIRWDMEYTETDGTSGAQSVTMKRNDPDTSVESVHSWWRDGGTPVAPGLTGFMPNRQTSRRKRM